MNLFKLIVKSKPMANLKTKSKNIFMEVTRPHFKKSGSKDRKSVPPVSLQTLKTNRTQVSIIPKLISGLLSYPGNGKG